jgi:tetratricopeptide (TPR) repeat protein
MAAALAAVRGTPSDELRAALEAWLRPRTSLAWAVRRLEDSVHALPTAPSDEVRRNREEWVEFVSDELGAALQRYESAATTAERLDALADLRKALTNLQKSNAVRPWPPSTTLQSALAALFDRPNVEASADVATLAAYLSQPVARDGPVYRGGQVSYVTAGPRTGFGLLAYDGGVAFYNKQLFSSYTPIRGFHQQVASDRRGRRAAKMYQFSAASYDRGETTVRSILRPSGLDLDTHNTHQVGATVCSTPQPGGGFQRFLAALLGQNQATIVRKVWEGAIGGIRQGVHSGSLAESAERTAEAEARQNARLAAFLIGNDTAAFGNYAITGLDLHSRPQYAWARGTLRWRDDERPWIGADQPKPARFAAIEPGVTADVHLSSVLTNLARGFFATPQVQEVENLLIVTRRVPPGTPPSEAVQTTRNADDAAYAAAVDESRREENAGMVALRVRRPSGPPRFAADREGNLVVIIDDLVLEVSAPPQAERGRLVGPPARYYRIEAPRAEFALAIKLKPVPDAPPRLEARIVSFDPGPGTRLLAINEDPDNPVEVGLVPRAVILGVLRARVQGRPIDLSLDAANLPDYALQSVSDLDPSGWMRVVLRRR